jgi:DNA-directed RNA polymerase sigma subunit (sigma70/sigma32)
MSVHGHNEGLGKKVARLLQEACENDNKGNKLEAFKLLLDIRVRYDILLSKAVVSTLTNLGYDMRAMLEVVDCRKRLFASVTKMVSDLALKRGRQLSGDVVEDVDLIQEALVMAMEAINRYRPDFTSTEDAGKTFTDYVYRTVSGNLSHFVIDSTRNVRVPRSTIDRSRPVYYAIEKLGHVGYDRLADEATRILADIRLKNARRKLIQNERYSAEEVYDILTHTQEEASMDAVISTDEFGHENTFGELIPASTPHVEILVDNKQGQSKLIAVLHDYCDTSEEREVLSIRWGRDKYHGLKATADHYRASTGRSMNKTKVAEIENKVFERVRAAIAVQVEDRVNEVAEALSS